MAQQSRVSCVCLRRRPLPMPCPLHYQWPMPIAWRRGCFDCRLVISIASRTRILRPPHARGSGVPWSWTLGCCEQSHGRISTTIAGPNHLLTRGILGVSVVCLDSKDHPKRSDIWFSGSTSPHAARARSLSNMIHCIHPNALRTAVQGKHPCKIKTQRRPVEEIRNGT